MSILEVGAYCSRYKLVHLMLEFLREQQFQQGQRDRDAGLLPRMQRSIYLEGYLKGRPEGLDGIVQYFPSLESYLNWKYRPIA